MTKNSTYGWCASSTRTLAVDGDDDVVEPIGLSLLCAAVPPRFRDTATAAATATNNETLGGLGF